MPPQKATASSITAADDSSDPVKASASHGSNTGGGGPSAAHAPHTATIAKRITPRTLSMLAAPPSRRNRRNSDRMKALFAVTLVVACGSSTRRPPAATPATPAPPAFTPTAFTDAVTGHGRPVIFIPGLASPGSVWDGTIAHLGGRVEAHVLTLAGFAGRPPIAAPLMHAVHDQLVEYIRAEHLDHPIVVGHSLGGVLSIWLAETDPDIGGIVDVDGLPFLPAAYDPKATAETAGAQGKQIGDSIAGGSDYAANVTKFLSTMITKPDDLARVAAEAAKSDPVAVGHAFGELFALDLRPDLAKIAIPVTIVASSESAVPADQLAAAWHAQIDAIPHVDFTMVPAAKHFVMLDQPDAFYALLDKALAK